MAVIVKYSIKPNVKNYVKRNGHGNGLLIKQYAF